MRNIYSDEAGVSAKEPVSVVVSLIVHSCDSLESISKPGGDQAISRGSQENRDGPKRKAQP
jgi:hypothetical protein